ncbi:transposase [Eubacteriaceae bacterium ES3]|nr:transposase [Eubacteriaceae bacterium ES3]
MLPQKQLSFAEIYADCTHFFEQDKHHFLSLLEEKLDLHALVPHSFYSHYYACNGRHRDFELCSILWAFILQRIFSIPTDTLLITFLKFSSELRDFCGFSRVPHASQLTRFKQDYLPDLQSFFHQLVDVTEPICQKIDAHKAMMTIFDTSGIEAYVTENNPKFANKIIKQLKAFKKTHQLDDSYDPYKAAYGAMPTHAKANSSIKQLYINGHFCYVYKFGMITNGLGIVRDISFYDANFLVDHPDIAVEKKSDSPDEDKSLHDTKALIPVLSDFFKKHPLIVPKLFIGDAAFDSSVIYHSLLTDLKFEKAFIPLNSRGSLSYSDCPVNEHGIPCCPDNPSLPMKPEGKTRRKNGLVRFKFTCPKTRWVRQQSGKSKRQCFCEKPCTPSSCGRMFYVYPEKNLRAYPGTLRGTDEWQQIYKIRGVVEQSLNHFKDSFCVAGRKTRNARTLRADLLLAGITQLITVILADNIHQLQYIRSLKKLIA